MTDRADGDDGSPGLWIGATVSFLAASLGLVQIREARGCTTPVLCHDVTPASVVIWSAPWLVWAGWRVWTLVEISYSPESMADPCRRFVLNGRDLQAGMRLFRLD